MTVSVPTYEVGGVRLMRPFKIRRLGHVGINFADVEKVLPFYRDLLGLMVSDELQLGVRMSEEDRTRLGQTTAYFMRHGNEHHSLVLFPGPTINHLAGKPPITPSSALNQVAWQVGSLREVNGGIAWLKASNVDLLRVGRDQPGSNWHVYGFDPDRQANELFYGMEQIGWDQRSKAQDGYSRLLETPPDPIKPEYEELAEAAKRGVDLASGHRYERMGDAIYDAGGVKLARPFKVTRVGPIRLFVTNLERSLTFYRDRLGLNVTEEAVSLGERCVFLRAGTEHHAIGLYPVALREKLGFRTDSNCMSVGLQVADYAQLKSALAFLEERGTRVLKLDPSLCPGMDYSAFVFDPEGQAVQLYYYMEQIGWDGRARPPSLRQIVDNDKWPDSVDAPDDVFSGETFLGPWG
jgi:catechol 2,3-dioxygenase-like lactoylglutathione lyase family enzyme